MRRQFLRLSALFVGRIQAWTAIAWLATFGATAHAWADEETAAPTADTLFQQARALMTEGKFSEACSKLEQSQRLDPGAGTLLNLAGCYENLGLTASAWATYHEAATLAARSGREDWEGTARKRAALLEASISTLTISVPPDTRVRGLRIERDGTTVESSQWGVPIPVDPGAHPVAVNAPGRMSWSTSVSVRGDAHAATITIPLLAPRAQAPVATSTTPQPDVLPREGQASDASAVPLEQQDQRTTALVVGGIGVVGLAAGTVFGLMAKKTYSDSSTYCDESNRCSGTGMELDGQAHRWATLSTVSFGVGAAALAAGGVLYFTTPADAPHDIAVGSAPVPGGATLSMGGIW